MQSTLQTSTDCLDSDLIVAYASCALSEEQAVKVDSHLSICDRCSQQLIQVIDRGVIPDWLPHLRELKKQGVGHPEETAELIHNSTVVTRLADETNANQIPPSERYLFLRLHAEGGMGQIWEGRDVLMKRRVALKRLRSLNRKEGFERRLFREASSLARLSHPNIVSVFDVLILAQQPTLVMEFINGPTLSQFRRDIVFGERQAAKIIEKLADAVAHAQRQGVIHRDLKPSNVLLVWPEIIEGSTKEIDFAIPKLTDFGLAKIIADDDLTQNGDLIGTPAYMAPEQTLGHTMLSGPSADIYGLGAILYELLTGTPPHVAEDVFATMLSVREREPASPRVLRPELSKDIETICLKCLQKLPKDRYASAEDLQEDLRAFLEGRPISARPISPVREAMRWSRRHKPIVATVVMAVALLLTIVLGSLWTARNEHHLRLAADEARTEAKLSEAKVRLESARVREILATTQEHFNVALKQVDELSYLVNGPRYYGETFDIKDYQKQIEDATVNIYASYLKTLPQPEKWTFGEAYRVCGYVEIMIGLQRPDVYVPWQDRLKIAAANLEKDYVNDSLFHEFLWRCNSNLWRHAVTHDDYSTGAVYAEEGAKELEKCLQTKPNHPNLIRLKSLYLMNAAMAYRLATKYDDAMRTAENSLEVYRQLLKHAECTAEDTSNFLDKLYWYRRIAIDAGKESEASACIIEHENVASSFPPESPLYDQVQDKVKNFKAISSEAE